LWTLNKLLKLNEELTSYDNIPVEIVLLSQHVERAMETVLYESVMTFSTTKILEVKPTNLEIYETIPQ